jgi:hypothetical protein
MNFFDTAEYHAAHEATIEWYQFITARLDGDINRSANRRVAFVLVLLGAATAAAEREGLNLVHAITIVHAYFSSVHGIVNSEEAGALMYLCMESKLENSIQRRIFRGGFDSYKCWKDGAEERATEYAKAAAGELDRVEIKRLPSTKIALVSNILERHGVRFTVLSE